MTHWAVLLSDFLSIITIVLCLILKVPQIIQILKSKQAVGLSFKGLLLELSSYTVTMMYNYVNHHALLSYLEYPFIVIQEYILFGLVMHYQCYKPKTYMSILVFFVFISFAFAINILDKFILMLLIPLTTPVSAISKVIQLMEIITKKNANSVSVLTWFLSLFTNATRIYTVLMDSADVNLLLNFSVSSVLSGAVMMSSLYYQKLSSEKKPE